MALMPPADSVFLLPETRDQPIHVGSLSLWQPPPDTPPDFLRNAYEQLIKIEDIAPAFRRRPTRSLATLGQWAWTDTKDIDLEHHVRHSALPAPGRIRELLALTSRLHGTPLDRQRPLWEMHLIEGLNDGRFALYSKLHHAVMDGVSGLKLVDETFTRDPSDRKLRAAYRTKYHDKPAKKPKPDRGLSIASLPGEALRTAGNVLGIGPAALRVVESAIRDQTVAFPMRAPRTIFNGGITGARRFAAQSWPLERLRAVAAAAGDGITLNDVLLAMCSGALRSYLLELGELPDASLTAMVPMSLRNISPDVSSGNAVGVILCTLGTDVVDPLDRLEVVSASMQHGKDVLKGMSLLQISALAALAMSPLAMSSFFGANRLLPPPFNLIISNVPGPRERLYWCGAELEALYPLSIPLVGQALNITVCSYADSLDVGLTGCRRSVPHLQRLLVGLENSLADLEKSVGA
jgi:diacylglycerol O-acyltransferase / wax synthase